MADLSAAVNGYYQAGKKHIVIFLEKLGYRWWRESFSHCLKLCETLTPSLGVFFL